jgi:hypothetical protein
MAIGHGKIHMGLLHIKPYSTYALYRIHTKKNAVVATVFAQHIQIQSQTAGVLNGTDGQYPGVTVA